MHTLAWRKMATQSFASSEVQPCSSYFLSTGLFGRRSCAHAKTRHAMIRQGRLNRCRLQKLCLCATHETIWRFPLLVWDPNHVIFVHVNRRAMIGGRTKPFGHGARLCAIILPRAEVEEVRSLEHKVSPLKPAAFSAGTQHVRSV